MNIEVNGLGELLWQQRKTHFCDIRCLAASIFQVHSRQRKINSLPKLWKSLNTNKLHVHENVTTLKVNFHL